MDQTVYRSLLMQLKGANVGLTRLGNAWEMMLDVADDKMKNSPARRKILRHLGELEDALERAETALAHVESVLEDEDPLSGLISPDTPVPSVPSGRMPRVAFARGEE